MSATSGPDIVSDGLVLCIDPRNGLSYPGSGTSITDLINNINYTVGGVPSFNSGGYLESNIDENATGIYVGTDQLNISISHQSWMDTVFGTTTGAWSILEWIRIDEIPYPEAPAGSVVSSTAYGSSATGFDWNHGNGMGMYNLRMGASNSSVPDGGTSYDVQNNISIDTEFRTFGKWMCRQMYWDRGDDTFGVYMNGVYQGNIDASTLSGYSIYDGSGIVFGSLYGWTHDGARGPIFIFNRKLSQSEYNRHYDSLKTRFGLT